VVTGPADFTFNGLHGTMTFESDGQGGFKISVSGSGFTTFTGSLARGTTRLRTRGRPLDWPPASI
jgi:hypothetical protein